MSESDSSGQLPHSANKNLVIQLHKHRMCTAVTVTKIYSLLLINYDIKVRHHIIEDV